MRTVSIILKLFPANESRGRNPRDPQEILNGLLWILRIKIPIPDMPSVFPEMDSARDFLCYLLRAGQRLVRMREDLYKEGIHFRI
jgi:hypothetical protein